jgi:hypothetical protein
VKSGTWRSNPELKTLKKRENSGESPILKKLPRSSLGNIFKLIK